MSPAPLPITPAQTVGPFLSLGLDWPDGPHAVDPATPGATHIGGRLFDGNGDPVADGMIETWQSGPETPGSAGSGAPALRGFARSLTNPAGVWEVVTLKPPPRPMTSGAVEAPHLDVSVFARGLLHRVVTRIYFADEQGANAADPVLCALPDGSRRATLLAAAIDGGYRFDIHLQGPDETVFFAV